MTRCFLLLSAALLLAGCPPQSRAYRPVSSWEHQTFAQTSRHVYPTDVRHNFTRNRDAKVAWTGIVRGVRFEKVRRRALSRQSGTPFITRVHLTVEHRYFDWLENYSSRKRIVLSSHGEGTFTAIWDLEPGEDNLLAHSAIHGMAIVYGTPIGMRGGTEPVLRSYHVRLIPKFWMADNGHYGRPTPY